MMSDEKYIRESIEKIFNFESKTDSFHYVEKMESSGTSSGASRLPRMDLELSSSDKFYLKWDTYNTLIRLYNNIEKNSKSRRVFIDILREKILNGNYKIAGHDDSSLAAYFLFKIGRNKDIIEIIQNRTNFIDGLFLDMQIFMIFEPEYFDEDTLTNLRNLCYQKCSRVITKNVFGTKIDQIIYDNLKKGLSGENKELNIHKEQVIEISSKFGFPSTIDKFLLEIDKTSELPDWASINSGMIGNLRAFFEELTKNIAERIKQITKKEYPKNPKKGEMGNLRDYIKNNLKLSDHDDKLVDAFVDILHKEGGHAFLSEKRYFLLAKNIGIEIAYFLLSKLEDLSEGKLHS